MEQMAYMYPKAKLTYEIDMENPLEKFNFLYYLSEYEQGLSIKGVIQLFLYLDSLQNLGTEKHRTIIDRTYKYQDYGSFSMTELGHGSNVSGLETTATYDHTTREFIISTPNPTA